MAFKYFTANPVRETNDCIIRSTANATGREWQEVMKEFCDIAIEKYDMPNAYPVALEYMNRYGYKEEYIHPSEPTTVEQFCKDHPTGRYIVLLEDHALSVIDGDVYDLQDCMKSLVVSFWTVK